MSKDKRIEVAQSIADFFTKLGRNRRSLFVSEINGDFIPFKFRYAIQLEETHLLPRYRILPSGLAYTVRNIAYGTSPEADPTHNDMLNIVFVFNEDKIDELREKLRYLRKHRDELCIVVALEGN
jgi:hypothetical protein